MNAEMLGPSYSRARKPATIGAIAKFLTTFKATAAAVTGMLGDDVGVAEDPPVPDG